MNPFDSVLVTFLFGISAIGCSIIAIRWNQNWRYYWRQVPIPPGFMYYLICLVQVVLASILLSVGLIFLFSTVMGRPDGELIRNCFIIASCLVILATAPNYQGNQSKQIPSYNLRKRKIQG